MTIAEIVKCLDAHVLCGEEHLNQCVTSACCSDLMSDALAFIHENAMLLTGITNAQVVRTAGILDLKCVAFVRGKVPPPDVIDMARDAGLVTMTVNRTMFTCAGLLYQGGLRGAPMCWPSREEAAS
ncbi:MAG: DRTGG domain-containing protein [Eubacteriales bacterium]|nr:DRTGG domain-containing protein [Eubacteriales bacterium]MDD4133668.1 DRTGG domain-containing protein [Eubacteriales bacterium]